MKRTKIAPVLKAGDLPALLPVPACGCCRWWRKASRQPFPAEARLHAEFEGSGSSWVQGWCGANSRDTWESTYCGDWSPLSRASKE